MNLLRHTGDDALRRVGLMK